MPWLPFRYLPALTLQLQLVTATKILLTPSQALMHLSTLGFRLQLTLAFTVRLTLLTQLVAPSLPLALAIVALLTAPP
jgi:hypothetical protein